MRLLGLLMAGTVALARRSEAAVSINSKPLVQPVEKESLTAEVGVLNLWETPEIELLKPSVPTVSVFKALSDRTLNQFSDIQANLAESLENCNIPEVTVNRYRDQLYNGLHRSFKDESQFNSTLTSTVKREELVALAKSIKNARESLRRSIKAIEKNRGGNEEKQLKPLLDIEERANFAYEDIDQLRDNPDSVDTLHRLIEVHKDINILMNEVKEAPRSEKTSQTMATIEKSIAKLITSALTSIADLPNV